MDSDIEKAVAAIQNLSENTRFGQVVHELSDIVDRNQNPGCGGDGSMSIEQWEALRDIRDMLRNIPRKITEVVRDTKRTMSEDPWWSEENKKIRNS